MSNDVQTNLLGKYVNLIADKRKQMNPPRHQVVAVFVGPYGGLKVSIADDYGRLSTVDLGEVDLVVPRPSW